MIPILQLNSKECTAFFDKLALRNRNESGNYQAVVDEIVSNIRINGDLALFQYTKQFDQVLLDQSNVQVTDAEIENAYSKVDQGILKVIQKSASRIKDFHQKQKQNSWFSVENEGEYLGQLIRPLKTVGVYVPGGKAAYPSSVLMNIMPARVAGVQNILMVTPCQKDGTVSAYTLVAAKEAGATKIFKIGGAQAIAALAFGTESIPKVDKIVGPGNIYVALAKKAVFGTVGIDAIAGPSEILVIADRTANPKFIAADLLSQAEHDDLASAILVTDCKTLAEKVQFELQNQLTQLSRTSIAAKSLENYGSIIVTSTIDEAISIANQVAPEHLEVCIENPFFVLSKIKNAGAIFLGNFSPEPLGDYMAGPNHVLPTGATARFFSPLSVDDFVKKSSVICFEESALRQLGEDVITFATAEGLDAHANAIKVRLDEKM